MTPEPNPARFEPHHDPIDGLLAQARWPEPSPRSEQRLLTQWEANWQNQPRRRYVGRIVAVAASLLVAVGGVWILHRHSILNPIQISLTVKDPVVPEIRPVTDDAYEGAVPSRPADDYERMVLMSRQTPAKKASESAVKRAPLVQSHAASPIPAGPVVTLSPAEQDQARRITITSDHAVRQVLLGRLLASRTPGDLEAFLQLMVNPDCRDDALEVLQTAPAHPDAALLFARFGDARVDCRFAAAKALGMMCDARVRAQLFQMVRANFHRREALAALLCCGDVDAASFLDAARANRSLNAQLRSVRGEIDRLF